MKPAGIRLSGGRVGMMLVGALLVLAFAWQTTPAHAVSDSSILAAKPPKLLSEFAFFSDAAAQTPADGVVPFALSTPLFSDFAVKYRFVYVPDGKAARYVADEALEFPVGTALIKTFAFPADLRKPDEDVTLIETRVLLYREDGWQAWAYRWNDEQTEATLNIAGDKVPVAAVGFDGASLSFTYSVPNKNQCKTCHKSGDVVEPIGPKLRNLDHVGPSGSAQLADWVASGILDHVPEGLVPTPSAADMTLPLDARARGYLDINCGHCHKPDGSASNSGLWLQLEETSPTRLGLKKHPTAAGKGSGVRLVVIEPGHPEQSILAYRMASTEPGIAMPELGRTLPDPVGIDLINAWIAEMEE